MENGAFYRTVQTIVFDVGGRACTGITVEAAARRARDLGLSHILIASTTGASARLLLAAAHRIGYEGQVVAIGEHTGYHGVGEQLLTPEVRAELEAAGARVFIGTHAFSSISRSFRLRWGGIDMAETVAETLRRVSRGTKVCFEMAVMAADADLIPVDRDVVAVGGSGGGADTALVIHPANMNSFFNLKVREFICLPRLRVAEVLKPVIECTRRGIATAYIAEELQVSPALVEDYVGLYERVRALVATGISLEDAMEQSGVGRQKEVAATMKDLFVR